MLGLVSFGLSVQGDLKRMAGSMWIIAELGDRDTGAATLDHQAIAGRLCVSAAYATA